MIKTINILATLLSMGFNSAHAEMTADECARLVEPVSLPSKTGDAEVDRAALKITRQQQALRTLRDELPRAFPPQPATSGEASEQTRVIEIKNKLFFKVLDRLLINPDVVPSDVVTIAFGGPARMGKSLLVNLIRELTQGRSEIGGHQRMTPSGRRGGTTKRALIVIPRGSGEAYERRRREVEARYPDMKPMLDPEDLLKDGPPLFIEIDGLESYPNLVFLDTPDITTGDRRESSQPVNLAKARDSLLAADFIIFLLDDDNLRDLRLSELIAEGFQMYGRRNTAFILRTDARSEKDFRDSRDWLIEATRRFYDLKGDGGLPKFVKGIFAMPLDPLVQDGSQMPELIPLANGATFPSLMSDLAQNSAQIRGVAGREAAKSVYREIEGELDEAFTNRSASEIYRAALEIVAAMPPPLIQIPYDVTAESWREQLSAQAPAIERIADAGSKRAAGPGNFVKARLARKKVVLNQKPPSFADLIQATDEQVQTNWDGRLATIIRELQQGKVTLPLPDATRLMDKIKTANRQFNMAKFNEVAERHENSNLVTVRLPSVDLLSKSAREELSAVFNASQAELMTRFTTSVGDNQVAALTEAHIENGLKSIQNLETTRELRGRNVFGHVAASAAGGGVGFGGPAFAVITGFVTGTIGAPIVLGVGTAGVGLGAAMVIRSYLDDKLDVALKPALHDWFTKLQRDLFTATVNEKIFGPVKDALDADAPAERLAALRKVRAALKFLMANSPANQD